MFIVDKLLCVLFVADSKEDMLPIAQHLIGKEYNLTHKYASTIEEVKAGLDDQEWDVVISDYFLSEVNSFELLRTVSEKSPSLPVVFVSDKVDEDVAAEAIRAGAEDFVFKDDIKRMAFVIERGMRWSKDQQKQAGSTKTKEEKIEKPLPKRYFVSIKDRVLVNYLLVFFAVLFIFGFAYWKRTKEAEALSLREAKSAAVTIRDQLSVGYDKNPSLLQQDTSLLRAYIKKLNIVNNYGIVVVDSNKKILAVKNFNYAGLVFNYDSKNEVQRAINDGITRSFIGIDSINGREIRQIVVSLKSDKKDVFGALVLEYDFLHEEILSQGLKNLFEVFILSFFVIALAFGLEFLNTKSILLPVVELKEKTVLMEKGNFETPIYVSAYGEVKELAESIEKARKKISESRQLMESEIFERKLMEESAQRANVRLSEWISKTNKQKKEIELLNQMSEFLQSCTTKDEAFKVIHKHLERLLTIGDGAIYTLNPSRNLFEVGVVWGASFSGKETFYPNECWAIRNMRLHFVKDSSSDMVCNHLKSGFSGSYFCVPIMTKGKIMGLFSFQPSEKCKDAESFCESRKQLMIVAIDCIALALSNLELYDRLLQQSVRDSLTNLFNRRYMEETLEREIYFATRNNLKVGVVMIDIDNFKYLNDIYGHRAGDKALQDFGDFLKKNVRKEDIVCRYGGDEFVLVLPKASPGINDKCVNQIEEKVQKLVVNYKDQQIGPLAVSIGTAIFPDHGMKWESVLSAADKAMYLAKQTGHNQAVVVKEETKA